MIITSGHISHGQMMALWHLAQNFRSWPSSALKTMVFQQFAMEHGPFIWYTLWFTLIFIPIEQCWFYSYIYRVWNSFRIFFLSRFGIFFGFLGWYHLPSVCNGLELEFVILHGICHIWACSPSILHGIYYMWACSPSILYGICHILACPPSILHGMFYMWACSPKYLQMRKLGIR